MLTLYEHTESPCCQKIRLVLAEKNLPYESVFVDLLAGDNLQEDFLALNPKAQVPVLVHKDGDTERVITESTVICDYLEDCFPEPPIFPKLPSERAIARTWLLAVDTGIHVPHTSSLTFTIVFRNQLAAVFEAPDARAEYLSQIKNPANREARRQMLELGYDAPYFLEALRAFDEMFQAMDKQLAETKWLAGDAFSIADIAIAPYIKRCLMIDLDEFVAPYPRVLDWYAAVTERESWQTEIASKDAQFVELFKVGSQGAWERDVKAVWSAHA